MKHILTIVFSVVVVLANAQQVIPFVDFNNYFKSFQNGFFRQIEFQQIREYKAGDDVVAYIDNRNNLRVFDGTQPRDLANVNVQYEVSDHLLVWSIGQTLNMWDAGDLRTLSYFAGSYEVKDSLIVFENTQKNSVQAYYNGEVYTLYTSTGQVSMPDFVGENIVAFRDNGNYNKVFWRGNIYELGVWHNPIQYHGGTDMLVFNDPITGTFAIFEDGEFLDVESFHMNKYMAGRGFIVYENQNNDLIYYGKGQTIQLSNFGASFWDVKDDVVIWGENSLTYALMDGEKIQIATYTPKDYLLKNNVVAFRNIMGGVDALVDGKVKNLTNQQESEYEIYGNGVLVQLFNRSYLLYKDGKIYRN